MRPAVKTVLAVLSSSIVAAAGQGASMPASDEPVSLKPNLSPGYEARVVMETARSSTQSLGMPAQGGGKSPERTISGEQTIGFLMKVVRSDDEGAVITFRIDDIEMSAKTTKGEFTWKSSEPRKPNDSANVALATMRPALGATITFTLDKEGKVVQADNGGVTMPTGELVDFMRLVVGNQEARARWSPVFAPKKGDFMAKTGQSWTMVESIKNPPLGQFDTNLTMTLKSADAQSARIDITGTYSLAALEGAASMFEVKDSKITGHVDWDRSAGLFKSAEFNFSIELKGAAQGLPIGYKTDTKVKIRREEVPPAKTE